MRKHHLIQDGGDEKSRTICDVSLPSEEDHAAGTAEHERPCVARRIPGSDLPDLDVPTQKIVDDMRTALDQFSAVVG